MSDFHYVRTEGPDGGVDAADGRAIGLDLASVLADGAPPFNVAVRLVTALAEILSIAEEDEVVHGDIQLQDVLIDETGAVSLEGFGAGRTTAPEGAPVGPITDRYGLGRVAFAMLAGSVLPELPRSAEGHENGTIDAVLGVDLSELPEDSVGDIQWFLARLLAWEPADRPPVTDAWRAFARTGEGLIGPSFAGWCSAALEGGGQRRDRVAPSGSSWDLAPVVSPREGPMDQGGLDFGEQKRAQGRSTGAWTRDGMKEAIQRVMASDYLEDPQTDWMPGTPIPSSTRAEGPRASDDFRQASSAPAPPRPAFSGAFDEDFASDGPEADSRTEVGALSVPTNRPVPPSRPRRSFVPDSPTVPAPVSEAVANSLGPANEAPARPSRGPARDPDTAPQLVSRPDPVGVPTSEPPPPEAAASAPRVAPPIGAAESPPPPAAPVAEPAPLPENIALPKGPDPFADLEEDNSGTYVVWGAVALFVAVAVAFCLGVGGVSGVAVFGMQSQGSGFEPVTTTPPEQRELAVGRTNPDPEPVAVAPGSRPVPRIQPRRVGGAERPKPARTQSPSPSPSPSPRPSPSRPAPRPTLPAPRPGGFATPSPRPTPRAAPPTPRSSFTTQSRQPSLPPPTPRPTFTPPVPDPIPDALTNPRSRPRPALPTFDDVPVSKPMAVAPRAAPGFQAPPSLPIDDDGSIVKALIPATTEVDPERPRSALQNTMIAHLNAATAARDAVIAGDAEAARIAVRTIGLINPPEAMPPNWAPYVADMKMEAWLMENSPDIPSAAFKVAQLGQSCAVCHAGVRAGPTVTSDRIPPRQFTEEDVMKRHGWASDWMWVGLLANDEIAWNRGAAELDQSPFPSVVHADFPEQRFMDLEDRLHQLASEAKRARTPDQRGLAFGRILATCSRCHDAYREVDPLGF